MEATSFWGSRFSSGAHVSFHARFTRVSWYFPPDEAKAAPEKAAAARMVAKRMLDVLDVVGDIWRGRVLGDGKQRDRHR